MAGEKRHKKEKRRHGKHKRKKRRRSRSSSGSGGSRRAPSPRRLLLAAALGDKQQCRGLIQQGADVAYADAEGTTALHEVRNVMTGPRSCCCCVVPSLLCSIWAACSLIDSSVPTCDLPCARHAGTATCQLPSCCCGGAEMPGWEM